jgi:hypothetical protein
MMNYMGRRKLRKRLEQNRGRKEVGFNKFQILLFQFIRGFGVPTNMYAVV